MPTDFIRVESGERNNVGEQEEFICRDAATIRDVCGALKMPAQNKGTTTNSIGTDTASFLSTITQLDLSQLVAVRQAHQTKRAANSIKTHANPQDVMTSDQPREQTDRRRLHAQMAEVICRAGSGLERGVRWKSGTAPGTRSLAEVSTLTGNSANAEVVAKERVNSVRRLHLPDEELATLHSLTQAGAMRAQHFNGGGINFSRYLTDGLVGDGRGTFNPPRLPLKAGDWAFVYWNGRIYVGQGILALIYPTHNAHHQFS